MATIYDKIARIGLFLNKKIQDAELKNKPIVVVKNRRKCVLYSLKEHKSIFYNCPRKGYNGMIKDIRKVTELYDYLIDEGYFIEVNPRSETCRNGERNYNPKREPCVYVNIQKLGNFLLGSPDPEVSEIALSLSGSRVNSSDSRDVMSIYLQVQELSEGLKSALGMADSSKIELLNTIHNQLVSMDELIKGTISDMGGTVETSEEVPQNASIGPLEGTESANRGVDVSEITKDLERFKPKETIESFCKKWVETHEPDGSNPKFDVYETLYGIIFVDRKDGLIIPKFDGFNGIFHKNQNH